MEEVDQIILTSFDNIGCEFAKDHGGLTELKAEHIVEAAVRCLKIIDPDFKMSPKFPPGMSARFRAGTSIAQTCQKNGYKGEIGYQTFLYPSEQDIRRVFMFLVEKLPKREGIEEESASPTSLLQRRIAQALRSSSSTFWLPPYCTQKTTYHRFLTIKSPLQTSLIADQNNNVQERVVTKMKMIPSFIEENLQQLANEQTEGGQNNKAKDVVKTKKIRKEDFNWKDSTFSVGEILNLDASYDEIISNISQNVTNQKKGTRFANTRDFQFTADQTEDDSTATSRGGSPTRPPVPKQRTSLQHKEEDAGEAGDENEENCEKPQPPATEETDEELENRLNDEMKMLKVEVEELKEKKMINDDELKENELLIEQMTVELKELATAVEGEKEKLKTKNKIVKLVSNTEENTGKLKELIEKNSSRKNELESLWDERRIPLEEEMKQLESEYDSNKVDTDEMLRQIQIIRRRMKESMLESKKKDQLIQQMKGELESMDRDKTRQRYTRRILEIVASIHKQKYEISNVIGDNRETQKIINQIRGRINRTFAIADEVFFKDAKKDESIRQAYKLLVALHDGCTNLIVTVEETGLIIREIRELERQIDKERSKNAEENFDKIIRDYKQVKKENNILMKQLKSQRQ